MSVNSGCILDTCRYFESGPKGGWGYLVCCVNTYPEHVCLTKERVMIPPSPPGGKSSCESR